MSEPSVDDIVAAIEAEMKKPRAALNIDTRCVRALIADWRKRGEALKPFAAEAERWGTGAPDDPLPVRKK